MRVVLKLSAGDNGGKIVGSRRASIVLPVPGLPIIRTLWPPAAATTSARLANSSTSVSATGNA